MNILTHEKTIDHPFRAVEREQLESRLKKHFGNQIQNVEDAAKLIACFKDGSYARSQMGLMLYTNGFNLRGYSGLNPNGLVYCNGSVLFGVGYFAKEGGARKHLHVVSPSGLKKAACVKDFIRQVRHLNLTHASVYVRNLSGADRDAFLATGFSPIDADPWHPVVMEEDEHYPNRIFNLPEILSVDKGRILEVKTLADAEFRSCKTKNRLAYNRFQHFLDRNKLTFELTPYTYSRQEKQDAEWVVRTYFQARSENGGLIGSTPEDYMSVLREKPQGRNERDFFTYLARLSDQSGNSIPIAFFAGEKIGENRVGLYATISMRFFDYLPQAMIESEDGFTAISQFAYMHVFAKLLSNGILQVDAGGSETKGLDDQKRQLGGRSIKNHWVVYR